VLLPLTERDVPVRLVEVQFDTKLLLGPVCDRLDLLFRRVLKKERVRVRVDDVYPELVTLVESLGDGVPAQRRRRLRHGEAVEGECLETHDAITGVQYHIEPL